MKNSIKIAVLLAIALGTKFAANAQTTSTESNSPGNSNKIIYSAGVESGITTGSFKSAYKWNLGGSLQADIPLTSQVYAVINAGYQNYFGKDNINGTTLSAADLHLIPLKAGLKFFPVSSLYIQGEAGAAFVLNKTAGSYDKTAAFIYAPQIGYQFPLSDKGLIDAGVNYQGSASFNDNSKVNSFGLRVAYAFSLK